MSRNLRPIPTKHTTDLSPISAGQIEAAIRDTGIEALPGGVADRLADFGNLLVRWNARMNLTSVRSPEEIIRRHFVESIFAAQHIPTRIGTLLDFGSGAGFPGIPIALARPEIRVTLAESQSKKAAFLREAVRNLGLESEVYPGRVEDLPSNRDFDAVTLRAVDKMEAAILSAGNRARRVLALMATQINADRYRGLAPAFGWDAAIPLPGTERGLLLLGRRQDVPRGT